MVMVFIHGLMDPNSKEIGRIIKLQDLVLTIGRMVGHTKDSGKITTCMEKARTNGQIRENIKDSMLKIRKKVSAFIGTRMEGVTRVCGRLGDNMEKAFSSHRTVRKRGASGRTVNVCIGLMTDKIQNLTKAMC